MKYHLLMISNNWPNSVWLHEMTVAWKELGEITFLPETDVQGYPNITQFQLLLIDASSMVANLVDLVAWLHQQYPAIPIVITTTSPTWQMARQVFLAGATDYVRRSFDMGKLTTTYLDVIQRHGPPLEMPVN